MRGSRQDAPLVCAVVLRVVTFGMAKTMRSAMRSRVAAMPDGPSQAPHCNAIGLSKSSIWPGGVKGL